MDPENLVLRETTAFNSRLQPVAIAAVKASDSSLLRGMAFGYGDTSNNGNVRWQTISGQGLASAVTQSYAYDAVNRLTVVSERASETPVTGPSCPDAASAWCQRNGYDRWGNRWVGAYTTFEPLGLEPQSSAWFTQNNQLTHAEYEFHYDGAGNLDQVEGDQRAYDAENRMVSYTAGGITTGYEYDADGRRVRKIEGETATTYVYDAAGQLVAEYDTNAPANSEYETTYYIADHLGSTRMVVDDAAVPKRAFDYEPFGRELPATLAGRTSLYSNEAEPTVRFTGKERDAETGLDYFGARYFSGAQGRFTSTDPLNVPNLQRLHPEQFTHFIGDPQNWNAYSYALNNPLANTDPDGYLTIVVPGTWNDQEEWKQSKFVEKVSKTFGEMAVVLNNPNMANTPQGRAVAAKAINSLIANHKFADGEKLNIVAIVTGGMRFSQRLKPE